VMSSGIPQVMSFGIFSIRNKGFLIAFSCILCFFDVFHLLLALFLVLRPFLMFFRFLALFLAFF